MADASRKVAIVTGSATGIGRATAILLAERGLDVVVNYSKSKVEAEETLAEVQRRGVRGILVQANVGDDAQVRRLVDRCCEELGGVDVLVNNAATTYFVSHKDLEGLTEQMWDDILQVNLKGVYFSCRAAIARMQEKGGSIVNVASTAGVAGSGSSIAYAASKGGVITMTKSLALAFAPKIRVNAVCPGPVDTRWLAPHPKMVEAALAVTPLRRASTPLDIAKTIVFLALDAEMVTAQEWIVDGGRTL